MKLDSFRSRISAFKKENVKHVFVYEIPDNSTFRYRVLHVSDYATKYGVETAWFTVAEYISNYEAINKSVKTITFVRCPITPALRRIIIKAKNKGVLIGFDTDDLVFSLDHIEVLLEAVNVQLDSNESLDYWFSYISRRAELCKMADFFTCSTPALKKVLESEYGKRTLLVPNVLGDTDFCLHPTQHIRDIRYRNQYLIGYMSGSPSHVRDFNYIKLEVGAFLEEQRNAMLIVRGFPLDLSGLEHLSDQIELRGFVEPGILSCKYEELDLSLAPLRPSIFTDSKSNIKYLEAAAVGTPTLATDSPSYSSAIFNGKNGYIGNPGEWLSLLWQAFHDHHNNSEPGKVAQLEVHESYSIFGQNADLDHFLVALQESNP
jgi:glycosyltransferase involved in cell wall biosynthesis